MARRPDARCKNGTAAVAPWPPFHCRLPAFGIGNMAQANSTAALETKLCHPALPLRRHPHGRLLAVLVCIHSIGSVSSAVACHDADLLLRHVHRGDHRQRRCAAGRHRGNAAPAFFLEAVAGGVGGATVSQLFLMSPASRGDFSNEAGLGSAPTAAAAAGRVILLDGLAP